LCARPSSEGILWGLPPSPSQYSLPWDPQIKNILFKTPSPSSFISWPLWDVVAWGPNHGCHGVGRKWPQGIGGLDVAISLPLPQSDKRGYGTCASRL